LAVACATGKHICKATETPSASSVGVLRNGRRNKSVPFEERLFLVFLPLE
jgi:hypothetical protein